MTPEQMNALIWFISSAISEPQPSPCRRHSERMQLFDAFGLDIDAHDLPVARKVRYCEQCGAQRPAWDDECRGCQ